MYPQGASHDAEDDSCGDATKKGDDQAVQLLLHGVASSTCGLELGIHHISLYRNIKNEANQPLLDEMFIVPYNPLGMNP